MKFLALLRKELRESLPYILIGGALLLGGGLFCINAYVRGIPGRYRPTIPSGELITMHTLTQHVHLNGTGIWLLVCSLALGVGLGVLHFWVPALLRTWPFLLHRSTSKTTIIGAKIAAAALGLPLAFGLIWHFLFHYACRAQVFDPVVNYRILAEGWIMIGLGFMAYLALAHAGLDAHRWYTTKLLSMGLALFVTVVVFSQWHLGVAATVIALALLVLVLQILICFRDKQF